MPFLPLSPAKQAAGASFSNANPVRDALDQSIAIVCSWTSEEALGTAPAEPANQLPDSDSNEGLLTPFARPGMFIDTDPMEITQAQFAQIIDGVVGPRIVLPALDTTFTSDGTTLAGRLVMPAGDATVPVVVLLHGAEHDGAHASNSLQRRLPAQGIGVFVYDKRGTGASGCRYTQDFDQLARDAVQALQEARRLGGARVARIGRLRDRRRPLRRGVEYRCQG